MIIYPPFMNDGPTPRSSGAPEFGASASKRLLGIGASDDDPAGPDVDRPDQ